MSLMETFYATIFSFVFLLTGCKLDNTHFIQLDDKLKETSGLILWKGDTLITHNDSGNKEELYYLDFEGSLLKTLPLDLEFSDLEEIK